MSPSAYVLAYVKCTFSNAVCQPAMSVPVGRHGRLLLAQSHAGKSEPLVLPETNRLSGDRVSLAGRPLLSVNTVE
jgi:hypothetical protein